MQVFVEMQAGTCTECINVSYTLNTDCMIGHTIYILEIEVMEFFSFLYSFSFILRRLGVALFFGPKSKHSILLRENKIFLIAFSIGSDIITPTTTINKNTKIEIHFNTNFTVALSLNGLYSFPLALSYEERNQYLLTVGCQH